MITNEDTLSIKNKNEFVSFCKKVLLDFEKNGDKWENNNLSSFLEAFAAYAEEIDGYYKNTNQKIDPNEPSWKLFADIIAGARIYE